MSNELEFHALYCCKKAFMVDKKEISYCCYFKELENPVWLHQSQYTLIMEQVREFESSESRKLFSSILSTKRQHLQEIVEESNSQSFPGTQIELIQENKKQYQKPKCDSPIQTGLMKTQEVQRKLQNQDKLIVNNSSIDKESDSFDAPAPNDTDNPNISQGEQNQINAIKKTSNLSTPDKHEGCYFQSIFSEQDQENIRKIIKEESALSYKYFSHRNQTEQVIQQTHIIDEIYYPESKDQDVQPSSIDNNQAAVVAIQYQNNPSSYSLSSQGSSQLSQQSRKKQGKQNLSQKGKQQIKKDQEKKSKRSQKKPSQISEIQRFEDSEEILFVEHLGNDVEELREQKKNRNQRRQALSNVAAQNENSNLFAEGGNQDHLDVCGQSTANLQQISMSAMSVVDEMRTFTPPKPNKRRLFDSCTPDNESKLYIPDRSNSRFEKDTPQKPSTIIIVEQPQKMMEQQPQKEDAINFKSEILRNFSQPDVSNNYIKTFHNDMVIEEIRRLYHRIEPIVKSYEDSQRQSQPQTTSFNEQSNVISHSQSQRLDSKSLVNSNDDNIIQKGPQLPAITDKISYKCQIQVLDLIQSKPKEVEESGLCEEVSKAEEMSKSSEIKDEEPVPVSKQIFVQQEIVLDQPIKRKRTIEVVREDEQILLEKPRKMLKTNELEEMKKVSEKSASASASRVQLISQIKPIKSVSIGNQIYVETNLSTVDQKKLTQPIPISDLQNNLLKDQNILVDHQGDLLPQSHCIHRSTALQSVVSSRLYGNFLRDTPDQITYHYLNHDRVEDQSTIKKLSMHNVKLFKFKLSWRKRASGRIPLPHYFDYEVLLRRVPKLLLVYFEQVALLRN